MSFLFVFIRVRVVIRNVFFSLLFWFQMEFPAYHQPYSHQTRFKVVRSTTKLVKKPKTISRFKFVRNGISPSKPMMLRSKSTEKPSTIIAKSIENKYKWIRTSLKKTESQRLVWIEYKCRELAMIFSFKLDRRKISTPSLRNGRINKRKARASLFKCLVRIRGVKFQTHPNGKCLQRLSKTWTLLNHFSFFSLASDSDNSKSSIPIKKVEDPIRTRAKYFLTFFRILIDNLPWIISVLIQRSIQISNGRYRLRNAKKKLTSLRKKKNCIYFNRFGKCHRGDKCPFIHDRTRIAVCTQ